MRHFDRRWALGLVAAAAVAIIIPAGWAWACVGLVSLTTDSSTVQPGSTVMITGREFAAKSPVMIHLDALDGPVLATAPPPTSTMSSQFTIPVVIPQNIAPGQHFLVGTQAEHDMNGGNPARALFSVGAAAPAAPTAARPTGLDLNNGLGLGVLALIALGVAVVSLGLAWLVLRSPTRRSAGAVSS